MPELSVNECPIDGCQRSRGAGQLMCKWHWYKVPKELRDQVWRLAKKMWNDEPTPEEGYQSWREAADKAIHAVEEREATSA